MTSAQGDRQAAVRAYTGTSLNYEGDWSALFDKLGIPSVGGFNGRLLAWINYALGSNYIELNGAMAAYAAAAGATNWSSMSTVPQGGGVFYYVDPAGSDSNDGLSPASAWQTIAKVNGATIPAGAWVLFKGGSTFDGQLTLIDARHSGTMGKVTKFGSYGTGLATINASVSTQCGVRTTDVQYLSVDGLKFTGVGRTTSTASGIFLEITKTGSQRLTGVSVRNNEVSGFGDCGILGWSNASDNSPSGYDDLLISNNLVHDNCSTGNGIFLVSNAYGLVANAATFRRPVIDGCKVYDNPGGYASPTGHSGSGILLAQCDNAVIQNCEAYNNGLGNTFATGPVGIWMYDCTNSIIQYCESHHNKTGAGTSDGGGFDLDGGCQNCIIQYCYSHDNYGSGYQLYQYNDAAIKALSGNTIRYNISENDGQQATGTKGGILVGTAMAVAAPNNNIYSNVIYSSLASARGVYFFTNPNQFATSYFVSNIFMLTNATNRWVDTAGTVNPGFLFLGNCYYATGSSSVKYGSAVFSSIASWRASQPTQETVASQPVFVSADPLLAGALPVGNIGGFDPTKLTAYQTQGASPCRGSGQSLQALFGINIGTRDLFGNPIPQGSAIDIGCYEAA